MKTLIALFEKSVTQYSNNPFMLEKVDGEFKTSTYKDIQKEVYLFAAGLLALNIEKGDRIALLSEGRNKWLVGELGVLYAGGINVPLSVKLDPKPDLLFRLQHAGVKYIIVSAGHAAKIEKIRAEIPSLQGIIYMDAKENLSATDKNWDDILKMGKGFLSEKEEAFKTRWQNVSPDDIANISYTSGTTADPKGIMLSQLNYTANVIQSNSLMSIDSSWRTFTILPWDHAFAHTTCLYCFMYNGASIASLEVGKTPLETLKNIPKNINEVKPHLIMSVPALAKNFRKNIENTIRQKGKMTENLFRFALNIAYKHNAFGHNKGKGMRFLLKPLFFLFDSIIFKKIRAGFGGELKFFIGGGALLDIELQRFFYAIGIPMCQGYGLSEASPVISSNSLDAIKFGSSGKLVKYLDIKIVDENGKELPCGEKGEIIIKGENVMKGYWENPTATAETIKEGWLYTGDLGFMDKDGYLYVLGRYKSLLVGNDGEKYSPEGIEEAIVDQSKYIDQCMLHNEQNAYTVGLIVPNMSAIKLELQKEKIAFDSSSAVEKALQIIQKEINAYKRNGKHAGVFPERWLPAAIAIFPEGFSEENKLMNSTLKMLRVKITERYANEIAFLLSAEGKNILNSINISTIKEQLKS
jgi:long-chain acyl-CoA synthetase